MRVRYRPAARADLDAIAVYTKREWGTRKARTYIGELRDLASTLPDFPLRFPAYASGAGRFRKAPCGEHLIFYTVNRGDIEIVRILHNRVDVDAVLG
jgi:toxin ParE1/3/4